MQAEDLRTVAELARRYQAAGFTENSIRWHLFNRERNGLSVAVVRVGRKLLVDESAWLRWLDSQRETPIK